MFKRYAAICVIALATIVVQVLVSRIVSVTLYYHFAFASISFVMLGLTAGALKVYIKPHHYSAANADARIADNAAGFARNIVIAVLLHVYMPALLPSGLIKTLAQHEMLLSAYTLPSIIILLMGLINSGVCIALLLTRFPEQTGKLYALDLIGGSLGCIVVILSLAAMDPISALIVIAGIVALMAWWILPSGVRGRTQLLTVGTVIIMVITCCVQTVTYVQGTPVFRLTWLKDPSNVITPPPFERWNSYSRVAISERYESSPASWGPMVPHDDKVFYRSLDIDASASTVLTEFNGDLTHISYLKDDMVNLGYHIRSPKSVAVIGVGGGRDILSALVFNATHVKGIEINSTIIHALTDTFASFTGHLNKWPGVSLVNAEARSYLNSQKDSYDLIQISLIDTWAATSSGGLTLTENKLYTTDAWNDFLNRLNNDGMLSISRWYVDTNRLLSIAGTVLKSRDSSINPRDHILASNVGGLVTVILSKSPFTDEEVRRFRAACKKLKCTPILTPTTTSDETLAVLASGTADADFFKNFPEDISPSTDDKPFFFNKVPPSHLLGNIGQITNISMKDPYSNNILAVALLIDLLIVVVVAMLIYIAWPMSVIYRQHRIRFADISPFMVYFACIGLGFMLIEVSQMQRLTIFLGHPVYGLSVVLFTLLLSSGIGSYWQQQVSLKYPAWFIPALLCTVLIFTGILTPVATEYLKYYDAAIRIVASALLIVPMGLCMGMMFPFGISAAKATQNDLLPWYWGINGAASVLASVGGVLLSLQFGISAVFWMGVFCYSICLLVFATKR